MRYLIAVAGLLLTLPHPARAQAFDWRPVNADTATMLHAGNYDAALPLIQDALGKWMTSPPTRTSKTYPESISTPS
jgi:hypothetical protein